MWKLAIGGAGLTGGLLWASSEPVGLGWLSWVAIVPAATVALSVPGPPGRVAVPLAYALYLELLLVPSLPFGLTEGQWGEPAVPVLIGGSPVLAVALVAIPLFALLLYAIGFGRAPGRVGAGAAWLAVAAPAIAWTALDFARAKVDPAGLWGPLFSNDVGESATALMAHGGPWLLTLVIVAVNYALALSLVRRRPLPATLAVGATAAVVAIAAAVAPQPSGPGERLAVAAIQPGYDTAEDVPETRHFRTGRHDVAALDTIEDLGELTVEAADFGAQLVVWPEASIWVDPREEPEVRAELERLATRTGVAIVVPWFEPRTDHSQAFVVDADEAGDGASLSRDRPKQRPMWFLGERARPADPEPLEVNGISVGTMLGVDTQDPGVARALARSGAELLASSTHDWRELAPHHAALARAAARATGLPVIRADWRYASAIYDRDGSRLADAGDDAERTVLVADISPGSSRATYVSLRDLVGWAALVFALGWLTLTLVRNPPFLKRV